MGWLFTRIIDLVEWLTVLLLSLMLGIVCWGVFARYLLNASPAWYDEFAAFNLVWLAFYSSVVVAYRQKHISFELVVQNLPPAAQLMVEFCAECLVLLFQVVLFGYGLQLTLKVWDDVTASLEWVKIGWIYSVLPISGGLMLLISLRRLVRIATGKELTPVLREGEKISWNGSSSE